MPVGCKYYQKNGCEISEEDIKFQFGEIGETKQIRTGKEIQQEEEDSLAEILEPAITTAAKTKPDTAFSCFHICTTYVHNSKFARKNF